MKIICNYLFIAAALIGFISCGNGKSDLKLSSYFYDFGKIDANGLCKGEVKVINGGCAELIINKVSAGCSCTQAYVKCNIVEPKDSTVLYFTFNPKNRKGPQEEFIILEANTDSIIHILSINAYIQ